MLHSSAKEPNNFVAKLASGTKRMIAMNDGPVSLDSYIQCEAFRVTFKLGATQ